MTSLDELLAHAVVHETRPARLDRRLRRHALAAVPLLAACAVWFAFAGRGLPRERPGLFLVGWGALRATALSTVHDAATTIALVALAAGIAVVVATHGGRAGSLRAHQAAFVVGLAGIVAAVPLGVALVITVANLVLWAVFVTLACTAPWIFLHLARRFLV